MSAIYLVGPKVEIATERVLEALWRVSEPYDEQAGIFVPLFVIVEQLLTGSDMLAMAIGTLYNGSEKVAAVVGLAKHEVGGGVLHNDAAVAVYNVGLLGIDSVHKKFILLIKNIYK